MRRTQPSRALSICSMRGRENLSTQFHAYDGLHRSLYACIGPRYHEPGHIHIYILVDGYAINSYYK